MKSNYYCTVAGLPDITLDDNKLSYTVGDMKEELYLELDKKDTALLDLFYLKYDNKNLLSLLREDQAEIDPRGVFTAEKLEEMIALVRDGEETVDGMPQYLVDAVVAYLDDKDKVVGNWEDRMASAYYNYAIHAKNPFISSWFAYNLNVNNIQLALAARRHDMPYQEQIVGFTEVSKTLRVSNARDFGLSADLDYIDALIKIDEISDLVERERKTDLLKWNWVEEHSFFDYFTIERLFVFLVQLEMVERWLLLDKELGNQQFRAIIQSFKDDVQIPEEFR